MDKKGQTIQTYNVSAKPLADHYDRSGVRLKHVEEVFGVSTKKDPKVLEIGCGSGRDASEMVKRTSRYRGIDISEEMIDLARLKVPSASFEVADVEYYAFPKGLDVIVAFASLIHVPKASLRKVMKRMRESLNEGGVVYLSMKYSPRYKEVTKKDEYGVRTYYFYSKKDIAEMASGLKVLKREVEELKGQQLLGVLLKKSRPEKQL